MKTTNDTQERNWMEKAGFWLDSNYYNLKTIERALLGLFQRYNAVLEDIPDEILIGDRYYSTEVIIAEIAIIQDALQTWLEDAKKSYSD